jgi:hypothetical protein
LVVQVRELPLPVHALEPDDKSTVAFTVVAPCVTTIPAPSADAEM